MLFYDFLVKHIPRSRNHFRISGLLKCQIHSNQLYTRLNQLRAFEFFLGKTQTKINNKFSLQRGHLAPAADFPLQPMQSATNFLVNTFPQWNTINQGNWKILENKIRDFATRYKYVLTVYTGGFGLLSYNDANNNPAVIYLSPKDKCLGVPKYIWKVIYHDESKRGIAFVSVNDPYANFDESHNLCTNICEGTKWNDPKFRDFTRGYIYCCEVDELRKTVEYIPKLAIIAPLIN